LEGWQKRDEARYDARVQHGRLPVGWCSNCLIAEDGPDGNPERLGFVSGLGRGSIRTGKLVPAARRTSAAPCPNVMAGTPLARETRQPALHGDSLLGCRISLPSLGALNQGRRERCDANDSHLPGRRRSLGVASLSSAAHPLPTPLVDLRLIGCAGHVAITSDQRQPFTRRSSCPSHDRRVAAETAKPTRAGHVGGATARSRRSRRARMVGWASTPKSAHPEASFRTENYLVYKLVCAQPNPPPGFQVDPENGATRD
jgi:hypothetical protein